VFTPFHAHLAFLLLFFDPVLMMNKELKQQLLNDTTLQVFLKEKKSVHSGQHKQLGQCIAYPDDKINEKVYTLYGLRKEEGEKT